MVTNKEKAARASWERGQPMQRHRGLPPARTGERKMERTEGKNVHQVHISSAAVWREGEKLRQKDQLPGMVQLWGQNPESRCPRSLPQGRCSINI